MVRLAQNLYTSSARFVFELLQNCDDNHYRFAKERGEVPRVSFDIHHDRVVMECNEDGFNSKNLTAICSVGKSSKTGGHGYVGEKGIGFKSVFMAAYEVQIQSGAFSFRFIHRHGDAGMGMITPIWQDHEEDLDKGTTRITLLLHNDGDAEVLAKQRERIRQQFRDIHDTILLFMRNLEEIEVTFYDDDNKMECTALYSIDRPTVGKLVTLTKSTTAEDGEERKEETYFHCTKHIATGLVRSENRTYSEDELRSGAYTNSEVVLAFPLDQGSEPILENQWLFAFLPVRQMGFKVGLMSSGSAGAFSWRGLIDMSQFLIQADFVTQANRQDIVTTSARNEGIAAGISQAFVMAVKQLCQHDKLRYQWMRYLPQPDGYPWDSFWKSIITNIGRQLQAITVLIPANHGPRLTFSRSRQLPADQLDGHGEPLFADIAPGCYLSDGYRRQDLALLEKLGLFNMTFSEFVARVAHDLDSPNSRLKSKDRDQDWRSRVANMLSRPFSERHLRDYRHTIRGLKLIPLRGGRWTSTTDPSRKVYFPQVDNTNLCIPGQLGLRVLHADTTAYPSQWNQLFMLMGVETASVDLVRQAILKQYHPVPQTITPEHGASYLKFLYLTQHLARSPFAYHLLQLAGQEGLAVGPARTWVLRRRGDELYIRDDNAYGAAKLLEPMGDDEDEDNAPGFQVVFLHDDYFIDVPSAPTKESLSWKEWLFKTFGIRRCPRLVHENEQKLSDICHYVAKYRPKHFLGFLQATWTWEGHMVAKDKHIVAELGKIKVVCEGSHGPQRLDLTYLPTKTLKQFASRFLLPNESFPWLQLEKELSHDTSPPEWAALGNVFGLGCNGPSQDFMIDILENIRDQNESAEDVSLPGRICELYVHLQADLRKSTGSDGLKSLEVLIRCVFFLGNVSLGQSS